MNDFHQLDFEIGGALESKGGILDKIDYGRLRGLAIRLRNIPYVREDGDGDFPPSSLQGWIASYEAAVQSANIAAESGLTSLLQKHSPEIRDLLSPEMIPAIDARVIPPERLIDMITEAKNREQFGTFEYEKSVGRAASREEIARAVVVTLDESIVWDLRPKVDRDVELKRLQIGSLIGKAATAGALTITNLALGTFAALSDIPSMTANVSVPLSLGIVGSTYTGLVGIFDAIEKIAAAVRA